MVAIAAIGRNCLASFPKNASDILYARPVPQSSRNGYSCPSILALSTIPLGIISGISWWSVTIISIPKLFAYSTSL